MIPPVPPGILFPKGREPHFNPINPPTYIPQGVIFAGSSHALPYLHSPGLLTFPDNGEFSFSVWAQNLTSLANNGCTLFVTDPAGNSPGYDPFCGTGGGGPNPYFQMNLASAFGVQFNCLYTMPFLANDTNWHHYLGSFYTNRDAGQKIGVLYVDDVFITGTLQDTDAAFISPIAAKPFYFGADSLGTLATNNFAVAEVWIAPNQSLLDIDVNGVYQPSIGAFNRRLFTSVFNGELFAVIIDSLPNAPIIFSGNAATFGANFGFGLNFGLVGGLGDALTHPGGIPI